ncbi:MAG: alpha/beta-type small acid-soluble spore protein [Clostridia bacterium]|nr:alpha/beta-type small acid-soluble spore protein [Clostridia bacterium]
MKSRLGNFKNEVASSMNINLQNGYNGDIAARDAGRIGGQMVKRMIEYAENNMNGSMNSMNNSNSGSNNMMR